MRISILISIMLSILMLIQESLGKHSKSHYKRLGLCGTIVPCSEQYLAFAGRKIGAGQTKR